jgi:putative membrane protein
MAWLFAFLHHAAAFALVAALAVELVLLRGELTAQNVRRLQRADMALGISAVFLLAVGLLRVFYFEKGAAYYFHNTAFLVKLALFALLALASVYPTVAFMSWRRAPPDPARVPALRKVVHLELAGVVVILLCAALMARGIGSTTT